MDKLKDIITQIIDYVKNSEQTEEKIDLDSILRAKEILDAGKLDTNLDCFKYFASLNLFNAYVKKDYAEQSIKDNYVFKKNIISAVHKLVEFCPDGVLYGKCDEKVIYLSVYGLQFSFHSVLPKKDNLNLPKIEWQKLRLQPFALYIFKKAIQFEN